MAGIPEALAMAAKRRGAGFARHLGVTPGSERYDAIKYGTARAAGWKPSREVRRHGIRDAVNQMKRGRR